MTFGSSTSPSDGGSLSFAPSPLKVTRGGKRGSAWVLVAMLAVATGAGCAGNPGTTAAAPTGQELLRQLAVLAERQPPKPPGRYDYVKTQGWYLDFQVARGTTTGQVDPTFRQQWIPRAGSGRLEETRSGRTTVNDNSAAGGLAGRQEWPTDPAALRAELGTSHPDYGTFEWFTAVGDVWNVHVVSPGLQAGLLRMLADERELTNAGTVTDRVGRTGVAVSTESSHSGLNTRYTLVFDPSTGMLLDFEQVLLEAGKLPVKAPATSSYTVWITTGHVKSVGDLPPTT